MCLDIVNKVYPENKKKGFGYKVVFKEDNGYKSIYRNFHLTLNSWNKAEDSAIITTYDNIEGYPSGFHFYTRIEDAKANLVYQKESYEEKGNRLKIIKIKYKNLIAEGKESLYYRCCRVSVSREIKFIKEMQNE